MQTEPSWQVTEEKIEAAVRRIVDVAQPTRVILFGSAARGEAGRNSDADFLMVLEAVQRPRQESIRIQRALGDIDMPVDILVISEERLRELSATPGLIYREVLRDGRVVFESGR
jgi:uncharacterized protein